MKGYFSNYNSISKSYFSADNSTTNTDIENQITAIQTDILNIKRFVNYGIIPQAKNIVSVAKTSIGIKSNYVAYLNKYGVPPDGEFDPVLLAEFD